MKLFVQRLRDLPLCLASVFVLSSLLGACGGGGGGTDTTDRNVQAEGRKTIAAATQPQASARYAAGTNVVSSTGVYIDKANGSDSNPGTESQPWKTLSRLANAGLAPGQSVHLRCGQVWREPLLLTETEISDNAVVTGYGSECSSRKPAVSGADNFSEGWTRGSGNVWSRSVSQSTPKITRMFVNGKSLRTAQWPKYGGAGKEYAYAGAGSGGSNTVFYVASSDLPALQNKALVGATIQVRVEPWLIEEFRIASFNSNTGAITLDRAARYPIEEGGGYVIQDERWMLQRSGEFHHDEEAGMLYLFPPTATTQSDLNSATVEGSVRNINITVHGRSGTRIDGIVTLMARLDGITVQQAPLAVVERIESRQNGRSGLVAALNTATTQAGISVRSSTFSDNWWVGINVSQVDRAEVVSNTVSDTGTITYSGMSEAAIFSGDASLVERNVVRRSAFRGIRFSGRGGSMINANTVSNFCSHLSDCGGIYYRYGQQTSGRVDDLNSTVQNNSVSDAVPSTEGAVGNGLTLLAGIYIDDYTQGVTVTGNLVRNVPIGIHLHNASYNRIESNKIWFASGVGINLQMDRSEGDYLVDNRFTGNQLVPTGSASGTYPDVPVISTSRAIAFRSVAHARPLPSSSNIFSGNNIVQLLGNSALAVAVTGSDESTLNLTASAWRSLMEGAENVLVPTTYSLYSLVMGPEMLAGGDFSSGLTNWSTYFSQPGGTANAASSGVGCQGPCAVFKSYSTSDQLYSTTPFTLVPGDLYVVRMQVGMTDASSAVFPYINRSESPWTSVLPSDAWSSFKSIGGVAGSVVQLESVFRPVSSDAARVSLRAGAPGIPVHFDSVSIKKVTDFAIGKLSDRVAAVGSPVGDKVTVSCASLGWSEGCSAIDVYGAPVTLPFEMAANKSKLLLKVE